MKTEHEQWLQYSLSSSSVFFCILLLYLRFFDFRIEMNNQKTIAEIDNHKQRNKIYFGLTV